MKELEAKCKHENTLVQLKMYSDISLQVVCLSSDFLTNFDPGQDSENLTYDKLSTLRENSN